MVSGTIRKTGVRVHFPLYQARAFFLGWPPDHRGADGVEFDIPIAARQLSLGSDQACSVATLPERAGTVITIIDVADVAPAERLRDARDCPTALGVMSRCT